MNTITYANNTNTKATTPAPEARTARPGDAGKVSMEYNASVEGLGYGASLSLTVDIYGAIAKGMRVDRLLEMLSETAQNVPVVS